jgi:peptidoglycan/xylan/chitin deacetylase (PgdA/CDA1 family)
LSASLAILASVRGSFVFSLDVELAWGVRDSGIAPHERTLREERQAMRWLLAELDVFELPATWALVGRLLLDGGAPESWEQEANTHTFPRGGAPRRGDALWYAADYVDLIRSARAAHEVGTHTFSHLVATDISCTEEIFRAELVRARDAHARLGLDMKSLVFPRNQVRHLDVLRELEVVAYRGTETHLYDLVGGRSARALHFADRMLGLVPPTYEPVPDRGLVNVPASMFLYPRRGSRSFLPASARRRQAVNAVRDAAKRGRVAHVWLHPYNLVADESLRDTCHAVFAEAARARDQGLVDAVTMRAVAERAITEAPRSRRTA